MGDPLTLPSASPPRRAPVDLIVERKAADGAVRTIEKTSSRRASPIGGTTRSRLLFHSRKAPRRLGIAYRIENVIDAIEPGSPGRNGHAHGAPPAAAESGPGHDDRAGRYLATGRAKRTGTPTPEEEALEAHPDEILEREVELAGVSLARAGNAARNPVQVDDRRRFDGRTRTGGGWPIGSIPTEDCTWMRKRLKFGRIRSVQAIVMGVREARDSRRPGLSLSAALGHANLHAAWADHSPSPQQAARPHRKDCRNCCCS